jgi:hypothetical protein
MGTSWNPPYRSLGASFLVGLWRRGEIRASARPFSFRPPGASHDSGQGSERSSKQASNFAPLRYVKTTVLFR